MPILPGYAEEEDFRLASLESWLRCELSYSKRRPACIKVLRRAIAKRKRQLS